MTIGVGVPLGSPAGVHISVVLFQPHAPRQLYSKMYLHADEEPYFVPGQPSTGLIGPNGKAALAICYELSVPEHAARASANGAEVYIASVAKSVGGVEKALQRLAAIALDYRMTVLMANCVGECDGFACAGRSSVWGRDGALLGQLDAVHEGILVVDTATGGVELIGGAGTPA
jgi:predicted amidohydrolase